MTDKTQNNADGKIGPDHPFFKLIEDAYRVFDGPKPTSTDVCENCCMDRKIEKDFFNPPIREMPLGYIWDWYWGAYPAEGVSKATWVYLLPRILELLAADVDFNSAGPEINLSRFRSGDRSNWSETEWSLLDRFQRAYLLREANKTGDEIAEYLDDYICMFALGGWPLDDLTRQIWALPDDVLAHRLWRDWCGWLEPDRGEVWLTAFWEGTLRHDVYRFYTSSKLRVRMAQIASRDGTPKELAQQASIVAQIIENAPNNPPPE